MPLGRIAADKPELEAHWAALDRFGHAMLASLTNGMSPASLAQASTDWALHLALAPGKQGQLLEKMASKALRWWLYTYRALRPACDPCIEPLPQDRRFADPPRGNVKGRAERIWLPPRRFWLPVR